MQYEIRNYTYHLYDEHGQWEIWQCVDGEWEHIPDEVYSYIDSEDKGNQLLQAELGLDRLMTVVKERVQV